MECCLAIQFMNYVVKMRKQLVKYFLTAKQPEQYGQSVHIGEAEFSKP